MNRIPFLLALIGCAVEPTPDRPAELPQHQVPAVFDDGVDWDSITTFEADPAWAKATLTGRAAGRAAHPTENCSGALIDDDIIVTAAHCADGGATQVIMRFGFYGEDGTNQAAGEEDLRIRLKQLGIPESRVDGIPVASLRDWACENYNQDGTKDVAYWECTPKNLAYTWGSETTTFVLKPGHLFGKVTVDVAERPASTPIYGLSQTKICGDQQFTLALSPGQVELQNDNCVPGYANDCFRTYADFTAGSSGGPLIDAQSHKLFGVMHADSTGGSDECDLRTPGPLSFNVGAYIGSEALDYLAEDSNGGGDPVGSWTGYPPIMGSPLVGSPPFGGSSQTHYRNCPSNMLAAGIAGTSNGFGALGNIGLVCMPNLENPESNYRLDRSRVVSAGSWDVGFLPAGGGRDFNEFMNQEFGYYQPDLGQHSLAMCPPGYFIKGLWGFEEPNAIFGLRCEKPSNGHTIWKWIDSDYHGDFGTEVTGDFIAMYCPGDGFVQRMRVKRFLYTDELRLSCYKPD